MKEGWKAACEQMVQQQILSRGITNKATIHAMLSVPRDAFVPPFLKEAAYDDNPLPIGDGQTISQPYIVAAMIEYAELQTGDVVLEIGTGSGYAAAVLAQIVAQVYTVERIASLAEQAMQRFLTLQYENIEVKIDDGTLGWPEKGPFDAILVTAAAKEVPEAFIEQMKPNARLVIPVGGVWGQELIVLHKDATGTKITQEVKEPVRFVPLIGKQGW